MKLITTLAITIIAAASFNLVANGADTNLSDFKFSKTVVGEKPTDEYLKGKVVVIEYWGVY
jgi:hypothetical protein